MKLPQKIILALSSLLIIIYILNFKRFYTLADDIEEKILESPVIAKVNKTTEVYSDMNLKNLIKEIKEDSFVEILEDKSKKVYLIKSDEYKLKGWIKSEFLTIPETPKSNKEPLKPHEVEKFINEKGLSSKTEYLVFTNIDRQKTYILKGSEGNWKLYKAFDCSTGLNTSPTKRGNFKISEKGNWFYSERLGSGAKYWVRFDGSYLFHSVAMDISKNIIDPTIGERSSSGCVRMNLEDIKWFYENIPAGTEVFIN